MSKKSPAFQFYPADWLSSLTITSMTPAQEGAYIRLLAYAWLQPDCGIPDDDQSLSQLSRLGEGWFNGASAVLRKCFFKKGNRLYNKRLLFERKKQAQHRAKSKEGGINSGKSRRDKKLNNEPNAKGTSLLVEPKSNSSSSSSSSSLFVNNYSNGSKNAEDPDPERAREAAPPPPSTTSHDSASADFQSHQQAHPEPASKAPLPTTLRPPHHAPPSKPRSREITQAGDIVAAAMASIPAQPNLDALCARIVSATREPNWQPWWQDMLGKLAGKNGSLAAIEENLVRVEESADPVQRRLKDIGEFQEPGRYMVSVAMDECRKHKVRWGPYPIMNRAQKAAAGN